MGVSARIRVVLTGVVVAASAFAMLPANAVSEAGFTIAGTGAISPGLTVAGGAQSFTFSGTGGGAGTDNTGTPQAGAISCSVSGNDTIGTLSQGSGNFSGSCNTPCGTNGVSGSFTRNGGSVTANGDITSGCFGPWTITIICTFGPTSPPPVISFALHCVIKWS
jgi:hypothetical protein